MFRVLSIFAAFLCVAAPAGAAGVVSVTWDGCTGPVSKTVLPGSQPALYASVIGQSEGHTGYQVNLEISEDCAGNPGSFPDVWRFDTGGCQPPGALHFDWIAPAEVAATCPSFRPSSVPALLLNNYSYDATTRRATLAVASVYKDGVPSADPGQRYFLARIVFDQAHGVVGPSAAGFCGGLETPLCLKLTDLLWLNSAGDGFTWQTDTPCLTVNDPAGTSGCNLSTPVRATTWGAIRGQYR
jgi:hypothetical protein